MQNLVNHDTFVFNPVLIVSFRDYLYFCVFVGVVVCFFVFSCFLFCFCCYVIVVMYY